MPHHSKTSLYCVLHEGSEALRPCTCIFQSLLCRSEEDAPVAQVGELATRYQGIRHEQEQLRSELGAAAASAQAQEERLQRAHCELQVRAGPRTWSPVPSPDGALYRRQLHAC